MIRLSRVRALLASLILLLLPTSLLAEDYQLETVAEGFDYPWGLAFLPAGEFLLSMRSGELRRVSASGEIGPAVSGAPDTYVASQGGFFDVLPAPDFARSGRIFLAFAHGNSKANATRIISAVLQQNALEDVQTVFTVAPMKAGAAHYGGKLLFVNDGTLLLTTGDGFDYREAAQDPHSQLGKVIRIHPDGRIPADNPFADGKQGNPAVWTYGHRSPQGLAYNPITGTVYMHEHGPKGGDEVNILRAGNNYGWPAITYGVNYSGALVSPFTEAPGMEQPAKYWVPSIAPSGLAFYQGEAFPQWRNSLFVGALVDKEVRRLTLNGDSEIIAEQALFSELDARIRDVRVGPDGFLYLLTDSDKGRLIRVRPKAVSQP